MGDSCRLREKRRGARKEAATCGRKRKRILSLRMLWSLSARRGAFYEDIGDETPPFSPDGDHVLISEIHDLITIGLDDDDLR